MREIRTSGSEGGRGGHPPRSTRRVGKLVLDSPEVAVRGLQCRESLERELIVVCTLFLLPVDVLPQPLDGARADQRSGG